MPLKILIDGSALRAQQGGLRTYIMGLAGALAKRPELEVVLATPVPDAAGDLGDARVVSTGTDTTNPLRRALWRTRALGPLIESLKADLLLMPLHEMPLRPVGVPTIMVVHDVGAITAPALYGRAAWLRYTVSLPWACSTATAVVCDSNATLVQLHLAIGLDPGKCVVIGAGPQNLDSVDMAAPFHFDGPYSLYVGRMYRFKNVRSLVRAFADVALPTKLVLAGPISGAERAELDSWLAGLPAGRVQHLGFVPASALASLYRSAAVVAVPSLHEGFGLPALEAMRAGVPVVASPLPAIREVAGDAALYVDQPLDPGEWSKAIQRVCFDDELRDRLVSHGHERASSQTWERAAAEFSALAAQLVR